MYRDTVHGAWRALTDWPGTDDPVYLFDYATLGVLFALVSVKAVVSREADRGWALSGKIVDVLFHFLLWPLYFLFYASSLARAVEFVDARRLGAVRFVVIWFFAMSVAAGAAIAFCLRPL